MRWNFPVSSCPTFPCFPLFFSLFALTGSTVLPRKSAEASITRSKADRDSSSCDATRERIALSASDAEIHRFVMRDEEDLRDDDDETSVARRDCEIGLRIFHSPALSRSRESGNFPLVARDDERKREREKRTAVGAPSLYGMAADGQNGGAVEDTWVIF